MRSPEGEGDKPGAGSAIEEPTFDAARGNRSADDDEGRDEIGDPEAELTGKDNDAVCSDGGGATSVHFGSSCLPVGCSNGGSAKLVTSS